MPLHRSNLGGEADVSCQLFSGTATVLEALDVQEQDLGQAVQAHALCSLCLLATHLTLEALISLQVDNTPFK